LWVLLVAGLATLGGVVAGPGSAVAQDAEPVQHKYKPTDKAWRAGPVRLLEELADKPPADATDSRTHFGGIDADPDKTTGFFRVEKIGGGGGTGWTLVDPDGGRFFSVGLSSVRPNPSERGKAALADRFGDEAGWASATSQWMRDEGFNTVGNWSAHGLLNQAEPRVAYTLQLDMMAGYGRQRGGTELRPGNTKYPNDCIFVFDPAFETYCDKAAAALAEHRDDPWLLGYFSDNELPLGPGMLDRFLTLPKGDPGQVAAEAWWADRRGDAPSKPGEADQQAFHEFAVERYYRIVSEAIRRHDPNHLYLGTRLHGRAAHTPANYRAAADHLDVVSVNYYYRWTPRPEEMAMWVAESGRPFMVTEWYAKGQDTGKLNRSGAGWVVKTQADRGRFYQHFALHLLDRPGCVGFHWFKYIDDDETGGRKSLSPGHLESNKGMLSNLYQPYAELVERAAAVNHRVDALRKAGR
jgi:hypothetical protein